MNSDEGTATLVGNVYDTLLLRDFFIKNNTLLNSEVYNTIKQMGKKRGHLPMMVPLLSIQKTILIFCRLTKKPKPFYMWMLCYTLLDVEKPLRYIP